MSIYNFQLFSGQVAAPNLPSRSKPIPSAALPVLVAGLLQLASGGAMTCPAQIHSSH